MSGDSPGKADAPRAGGARRSGFNMHGTVSRPRHAVNRKHPSHGCIADRSPKPVWRQPGASVLNGGAQ
jgi:hypothetical protein